MSYDNGQGMNGGNRRPMGQRYNENVNYSPSTSFGHGMNNNNQQFHQQPRRRTDRFKRETLNQSDRVARQNDIIISLLKEIRDRLPQKPGIYENDRGFTSESVPVAQNPQGSVLSADATDEVFDQDDDDSENQD